MSSIRKIDKQDYSQWLKLWNLYLEFYGHELSEEVKLATFQRIVYANSGMRAFVYEKDGEIAGIVHFIYHASTWSLGNYCYLQDLYVLESHRNSGIATQLIEAVYRDAEEHNASRVYWLTHESNKTAIKLYEKVADNAGFLQFRKNFKQ